MKTNIRRMFRCDVCGNLYNPSIRRYGRYVPGCKYMCSVCYTIISQEHNGIEFKGFNHCENRKNEEEYTDDATE